MNKNRVFLYNSYPYDKGDSVVYWMSRDQRVFDNHALLSAARFAQKNRKTLLVVFCLTDNFPGANLRSFDFMVRGLCGLSSRFADLQIPFSILHGNPVDLLIDFLAKNRCAALFSDFDPLRVKRRWKEVLNDKIECAHFEIDTHNVVPCRIASQKEEFGAYTIRPKIGRLLPDFIEDLPVKDEQTALFLDVSSSSSESIDPDILLAKLNIDRSVLPISISPGENAAQQALAVFLSSKLSGYNEQRNFPEKSHQSDLSPYLHFGQLSAQRVAIEVRKANASEEDKSAFLEELIVRRELSDNYCFYNPNYDTIDGVANWAKKTLQEHALDEREYLYSLAQFESAYTHDRLWNAAQQQLLKVGKIHGYMRMYWAKKILEWSESPAQALEFAISLNDKYSIDGRDPNGYVGCQWAIGGLHDRAWSERPVFGKIRFMNYNGCKRKFDVEAYIRLVEQNGILFG